MVRSISWPNSSSPTVEKNATEHSPAPIDPSWRATLAALPPGSRPTAWHSRSLPQSGRCARPETCTSMIASPMITIVGISLATDGRSKAPPSAIPANR